jgi:DNA repair protein RadC
MNLGGKAMTGQMRSVMREVPVEERPRERMQLSGAEALSNAELLAILLRTGTKHVSAIQLAQQLLMKTNGLHGLVDFHLDQFTQIPGLGKVKAMQIKAGIELGRRLAKTSRAERYVVRSPEDAANYLMEDMRYLKKEQFVCLYLNTKNEILAQETLSIGSVNASIVHPREVFQAAILHNSTSFICAHNHPSGDPTPSPEDLNVTKRLKEVGELMGIPLIDHIIIGERKFISLKQRGLI